MSCRHQNVFNEKPNVSATASRHVQGLVPSGVEQESKEWVERPFILEESISESLALTQA